MPKQRNIDSDGKGELTSGDLAERFVEFAQAEGVELRKGEIYGANLEALMRPGEQLHSNRRAFFEPDPLVYGIVSKEMEDIKRLERALKAAGTDPQARDELLWMMIGQNSLHWMTVQSLLDAPAGAQQEAAPASNGHQPNAQQEAPAPESKKPRKRRRECDVARFCRVVGMDRNEVYDRCKDGSILASQGNGPGCEWRISDEEIERYKREGPRGQAR